MLASISADAVLGACARPAPLDKDRTITATGAKDFVTHRLKA